MKPITIQTSAGPKVIRLNGSLSPRKSHISTKKQPPGRAAIVAAVNARQGIGPWTRFSQTSATMPIATSSNAQARTSNIVKCESPRSLIEFSLQRQREQFLIRLDQMLVTFLGNRAGILDL